MAQSILVFLVAILINSSFAGEIFFSQNLLGEKNLIGYHERYLPLIKQDPYLGGLSFQDKLFFQNFFSNYLFPEQEEIKFFLNSELKSGESCSNQELQKYSNEIRYGYRLITLSYFIESQQHLNYLSSIFKHKEVKFDLKEWIKTCEPKSQEMKLFLERMLKFYLQDQAKFDKNYGSQDWFNSKNEKDPAAALRDITKANQHLMTLICSEKDELYGLSKHPMAYSLLGQSHFINSLNKAGHALNCLRRYSEIFAYKEVNYPELKNLFLPIEDFLRSKFKERYIQGRVFFYGSGKEFDEKGLKDIYTLKDHLPEKEIKPSIVEKKKVEARVEVAKKNPEIKVLELKAEKKVPLKSAFLEASEVRQLQNLSRVEVDMEKFKYDYVFSLTLINELSSKLKNFMSREALLEMKTFDQLGSKAAPVPLIFIKYMIDMQEHQGLWNLISILGKDFYVSNEIDSTFKPSVERIELIHHQSGRWQLVVIKPSTTQP
ncbi:MAG: hypothetical protein AB7I27_18665 [Bacteriovoracaceae bacterium]